VFYVERVHGELLRGVYKTIRERVLDALNECEMGQLFSLRGSGADSTGATKEAFSPSSLAPLHAPESTTVLPALAQAFVQVSVCELVRLLLLEWSQRPLYVDVHTHRSTDRWKTWFRKIQSTAARANDAANLIGFAGHMLKAGMSILPIAVDASSSSGVTATPPTTTDTNGGGGGGDAGDGDGDCIVKDSSSAGGAADTATSLIGGSIVFSAAVGTSLDVLRKARDVTKTVAGAGMDVTKSVAGAGLDATKSVVDVAVGGRSAGSETARNGSHGHAATPKAAVGVSDNKPKKKKRTLLHAILNQSVETVSTGNIDGGGSTINDSGSGGGGGTPPLPVTFGHWISAFSDLSEESLAAVRGLFKGAFKDSTKDLEQAVGMLKYSRGNRLGAAAGSMAPSEHQQDALDASVSLPATFVHGIGTLRQQLAWAQRHLHPTLYTDWHATAFSEMGVHLCTRIACQEGRGAAAGRVAALLQRLCRCVVSLFNDTLADFASSGTLDMPTNVALPHGIGCLQEVGKLMALPSGKASDLQKVLGTLSSSVFPQNQGSLETSVVNYRKSSREGTVFPDPSLTQIHGSLSELGISRLSPHQTMELLQVCFGQ
jgi:hypothetical protein